MSQRRQDWIAPTFSTGFQKIMRTQGADRSLSIQNPSVRSPDPPHDGEMDPNATAFCPGYDSQLHPVGAPQARIRVVSVDVGTGGTPNTTKSLNPGPANVEAANVVRYRAGATLTVSQAVTSKIT